MDWLFVTLSKGNFEHILRVDVLAVDNPRPDLLQMKSTILLKRLSELSQHLASATDLEQANAIVVQAPMELVNARGAALWLFDGSPKSKLVASRGLEKDTLPDLTDDHLAQESFSDNGGNWLVFPLRRNERLIGALTISLPDLETPTEEQLELLRTWAHQSSAIIESHRTRALETIAFREVDRAVRADLNVRELMERLLNQMIGVCEAEGGTIYLYDAELDHVETWVSNGLSAGEEFARTVIRNRRAESLVDNIIGADWAIGAPMMLGSRIEGAAVLTRSASADPFPPRCLEILSTLSSSAALIVRNAELYARSEEAVIAEERTRFAREIHDGLAQDLGFLVLKIGAALKLLQRDKKIEVRRELLEVTRQLRRDTREVRRMIFALRPFDIESQGFMPALEKYMKEFAQLHDIELHINLRGEITGLSPKMETALFRLVQESLNNIRKHAHATQAWIDLNIHDQRAWLEVKDNGKGFLVASVLKNARERGSFGLTQMRERVERGGGTFNIESAPHNGTYIRVELPVRGS
jgi:signal transduction histidine kinase